MRQLLKRIKSYFPTPLPITMKQYDQWLSDIVELCGPIADRDSLEWVISNEVMRLTPGKDRVPKYLFVKLLRKYAANQFAAHRVTEIKMRQEEMQKQAQEAAKLKSAEATAQSQVASNETQETAKS